MSAFSVFKDNRGKRSKPEIPTAESHYAKLARRISFIRYSCLVLVAAFAVYSFSFHSDELTLDNFRYMLKFINLGEEADTPKGNLIAFDGSSGNRGIIYKGDLAVLNESGLSITGWDGEILHKTGISFDHPKMIENGINLFCYDIGGKDIRIFNSYSQVWSPETPFEYPIYWLSASKSGGFAVVSSAKSYRSAVYVYDSAFRLVYSRLFGDKYVDFVVLSDDGKEFITAAHHSENGNLVTIVSRFGTDSEEVLFSEKFIGEIPLGIYYTSSGYCLMTSDALRFYNGDDTVNATVGFENRKLLSGKVFDDRALVLYGLEGLSGGTEAVVYRNDGSVEFSKRFDTSLSDSLICGDSLYTVSPGRLSVFEIGSKSETVYSVPTAYSSLTPDGERVILLSENQAEYFYGDAFEILSESRGG